MAGWLRNLSILFIPQPEINTGLPAVILWVGLQRKQTLSLRSALVLFFSVQFKLRLISLKK